MSDSDSGGMTAVVAIVAIIVILGIGFFLFQTYAGNKNAGPSVKVEMPAGQPQ